MLICDASPPSSTATSSSSSSSSSRSITERGVAAGFLGQIPIVTDRASRKSLVSLSLSLSLALCERFYCRVSFPVEVSCEYCLTRVACYVFPVRRWYYEFLSDERGQVAYSQIHASPRIFCVTNVLTFLRPRESDEGAERGYWFCQWPGLGTIT